MSNVAKRKIFKQLGVDLITRGVWFLNRAFNVRKSEFTESYLRSFLFGLGITSANLSFPDSKYYLLNKATIEEIIKYDWTDKKKYVSDWFDCDNFASVFAAHMMEIYGVNSVGIMGHVEMLDKNTGAHHGWHRINMILVVGNGLEAYMYEPQTDEWQKIEKGKKYVFGKYEYKIGRTEFN